MTRRFAIALLSLALGAPAGCRDERPSAGLRDVPEVRPAPASGDLGESCADVSGVRACWSSRAKAPACTEGACLVARDLPAGPVPTSGFRCFGSGAARLCEARSLRSGPFRCDGPSCVQRHPRMPDDGEWECLDRAGAVVCRGGNPAAGVVPGRADEGWFCGERRGREPLERICVDLSPDEPPAQGRFACAMTNTVPPSRACSREAVGPELGEACGSSSPCPRGAACAGGRCLPPRPEPACWLDADCDGDRFCAFGTCTSGDG